MDFLILQLRPLIFINNYLRVYLEILQQFVHHLHVQLSPCKKVWILLCILLDKESIIFRYHKQTRLTLDVKKITYSILITHQHFKSMQKETQNCRNKTRTRDNVVILVGNPFKMLEAKIC